MFTIDFSYDQSTRSYGDLRAPATTPFSMALCSALSMLFACAPTARMTRGLRALTAPAPSERRSPCVMASAMLFLRYNRRTPVSIRVTFKDGIFEPLEEVKGLRPGQSCTVFSDEDLRGIRETLGWLNAAEKSFEFWHNADDAFDDTP